jgi:hypothetical protein
VADSQANDTIGPVGKQISTALAQHEINNLLDVVFTTLPLEIRETVLSQLSGDTRQIIDKILAPTASLNLSTSPSTTLPEQPLASIAKLKQTWSKLWREWDDIVFAAAEEDGRYWVEGLKSVAGQSAASHREALVFDAVAFTEDLNQVASRMLPMLQIAFDKGFFPDTSFGVALREAEAGISRAMPDGAYPVEKFRLGNKLTTCLLQWEWMLTLEEEQDAYHFAQRVRQWEDRSSRGDAARSTLMALADNAVAHFFTQLSQADGLCIFEGLSQDQANPLWRSVLENPSSPWSILYRQLVQQYASSP